MRYNLRLMRDIALAVFLCISIYLYAYDRVPTTVAQHIPSLDSLKSYYGDGNNYEGVANSSSPAQTTKIDSISSLWHFWSNAFHDNDPSVEKIRLSNNAGIIGISSDDFGPREPPHNRVVNPESDIVALGKSHASLVKLLRSQEDFKGIYKGAGVVTVGGGEYFGPAIIGLHMLRKSGSTLPVEIFVADKSEYEGSVCKDYLPKLGAKCLILSDFLQDKSEGFEVTHYQLKSLAMLFCSFEDVLYLDSDSIPLVDPATDLFSTEPYKSTGLVIWPDFWISTESPYYYNISGFSEFPPNLPKSSSEAGQLLISKRTHLKTLLLANYYNIYGPKYYYPLLSQGALGQGDKETFMAAALVLGEPYYRVKTGVKSVGRHTGYELKGSGMIQSHPADDLKHSEDSKLTVRPAFLHANTPKMNAGHLIDEGDLLNSKNERIRLWGSLKEQEEKLGHDAEKVIWELLVQTGCELAGTIREWKGRDKMCERLEEHFNSLFVDEEKSSHRRKRIP